jgi:1-phosphofructokinase
VDASGPALRHAIAAAPEVIKPNRDELVELVGRPLVTREDVVRAARDLQASGISLVVVSLGAEGAVLCDAERALFATPPRVDVATTVGAGDALLAGVLAARIEGGDLEACARLGTAFAAVKVSALGWEPPLRDRLEAWMAAVRIDPVGSA